MKIVLSKMVIGRHPDVPPGTIAFNPDLLRLFEGLIGVGDIVKVNGEIFQVISSPLAPPKEAGGLLIHGERPLPPYFLDEGKFRELVSLYKKGEGEEIYGPFFGYHVPNAIQIAERRNWKELFREWGGEDPPKPGVEIEVIRRKFIELPQDVHGKFPGDRRILEELLRPLIEKEGHVGEISVIPGEEDVKKIYYRAKSGVGITEDGISGVRTVILPGDRNAIPPFVADYLLRVYRYLEQYTGKSMPKGRQDLLGNELLIIDNGKALSFKLEAIEGKWITLRKPLYWSAPKHPITITVTPEHGGDYAPLSEGKDFPYEPIPDIPPPDTMERTLDVYVSLYKKLDIDPKPLKELFLLFLREKESYYTSKYKCTSCGEEYPRSTLSGKCVRCGGVLEGSVNLERPPIEEWGERWNVDPIRDILKLYSKRVIRRKGESILDY